MTFSTSRIQHYARQWNGESPEHVLLAAILLRATADAIQTDDPDLADDAMTFLDSTAPYIAERLRRELPTIRAGLPTEELAPAAR